MSRIPNAPPADIFNIQMLPLKSFLADLPAGAMLGMRRAQEGWTAVAQEINSNQPKYGERAGITPAIYAKFEALNTQHDQILVQLPLVAKAHEVLKESLAHVDNLRHRLATAFADSAESHARAEGGDPTLLTAYEKTIKYRSVIADKAWKTRKKNQDGWEGVFQEIISNQALLGERAGITATNFAKFEALDQQYDQIRTQLPLVEKAHEVLIESLAHIDNLRHRLAATFADSAEANAHAEGGDPTLLTAYEKTIAYRSVSADKGVKTRQKKKQAAAASP